MTDTLESKSIAVMLAMNALKAALMDAPLDEAMACRERVEDINKLSGGMLLLWENVDSAMDGRDEIELLRNMGGL